MKKTVVEEMTEESLDTISGGIEVTKKTHKFDALAYAVAVLGPPHEIPKKRFEGLHGLVAVIHSWGLPCGRWLEVDEWNDGDQVTAGGSGTARWDDPVAVRGSDDGRLCPEYEEKARAMIDAYAEAVK